MGKQREDGRYIAWARIAPGPKGRVPKYGRTQEEADEKARALVEESRRLATPISPPIWIPGSFEEFVYEVWTPHVYPGIRATTRRSYTSILRLHVLPALGPLQIADIGYREVKTAIDGMMRADGAGALPDRRRNEATMRIKEILGLYVTLQTGKGVVARTDWQIVKAPKRKKRKERVEPPADFTAKVLAACAGRFEWAKGPVFVALFLGLRRGEVAGLMWSDIDRKALKINVYEQRQPEHKTGRVPTKGAGRTIPVPAGILEWLDRLGDKESVFVFTGASGTPVPVDELSKVAPRLCDAAGLERVTYHDLRSFAASNLHALGIDPLIIMEILGHTKIDVTLLYLNAKSEQKRAGLEKLLDQLTG